VLRERARERARARRVRVIFQDQGLNRVINLLLAHANALTDLRTGAVIRAGCSSLFVRARRV
jgi:hypothetical protein